MARRTNKASEGSECRVSVSCCWPLLVVSEGKLASCVVTTDVRRPGAEGKGREGKKRVS